MLIARINVVIAMTRRTNFTIIPKIFEESNENKNFKPSVELSACLFGGGHYFYGEVFARFKNSLRSLFDAYRGRNYFDVEEKIFFHAENNFPDNFFCSRRDKIFFRRYSARERYFKF